MPQEDWRERLRQEYLASLPEKLAAIQALCGALRTAPADRQAFAGRRGAVHRLAGSAGTHGLEALGATASSWDEQLASIEAAVPGPDDLERMVGWLDEVRRILDSRTDAVADSSGIFAPTADDVDPSSETPLPVLRVLLVDDVSSTRQVTQRMLEQLGQRAEGVRSGAEALEAVRRQPYDLVLMDVQMPEMDGLEAVRRIRADGGLRPQPRVVAMSASRAASDVEHAREAGMDGYVVKPVTFDDLRRELTAAANRSSRSP